MIYEIWPTDWLLTPDWLIFQILIGDWHCLFLPKYPNSLEVAVDQDVMSSVCCPGGQDETTWVKGPLFVSIFLHNDCMPTPAANSGALQHFKGHSEASLFAVFCFRLCLCFCFSGTGRSWHGHDSAQLPRWSHSLDSIATIAMVDQSYELFIKQLIRFTWARDPSSRRKGFLVSTEPLRYVCMDQESRSNFWSGSTCTRRQNSTVEPCCCHYRMDHIDMDSISLTVTLTVCLLVFLFS